ncbi:hypothetical protein INT45_007487 [Circinella minor]|uniref:ubiquitinyl hydrolase 1 n=1 Tax=Circinella minor TaxID=1195481 RepID=A0A8H7SDU5_9FUNG|nr:hypothetical protein INT45_007487 [Circinella minor]
MTKPEPEVNPMSRTTMDGCDKKNNNDKNNNITQSDDNNNMNTPEEKEEFLPPTYDEPGDTPMSDTNDVQVSTQSLPLSLSVTDDLEAIVDNHFTKLDQEIVDTQVFHWEISNWSDLPKRVESPVFEAGGYQWSILLFPEGNNQSNPPIYHVSIYIKLVDIEKDKEVYACAQFATLVSRPSDPTNYHCLVAQHRFTQYASDWGFLRMIPLNQLKDESRDGLSILEDNCIRISAIVQLIKDETGVLWHNFINYDSKKMTGFVGLKNQGATCYMNSLFQSLYCTNYFRKAVYQIPTDQDGPTESTALAIQRLFYNLQSSDTSVDTIEVTMSFGWNTSDAFMQHDNTPADGAIKKLFKGRMKSYIKCINVQLESSRTEDYYDIQLNVKGCKNLEESFENYIGVETMEGENKYQAEGYGLQDAKKGVIFESFPPVLHLQLKRFEYDMYRDTMVKNNDRQEFPLEIELEPYMDTSVEHSEPHKYILHGVLVHSGDLTGGHYFAFVKPTKEERWLKFDDDRVTPATLNEVLEDNYGGEPLGIPEYRSFKRSTNAYMLVYIRESMQDEILAEVSEHDIPTHLVRRFEHERIERERILKEETEQHLYIFVQVVTEKAFKLNEGLDFIAFDENLVDTTPTSPIQKLRIRKDMTFGRFKELLAEKLAIPKNQFRVWSIVNRQNQTIRPDTQIIEAKEENKFIGQIVSSYLTSETLFRIFIERVSDDQQEMNGINVDYPIPAPDTDILIFIKYFDIEKQLIRGIGYLYANQKNKVESIVENIKTMIGFEPEVEIDLYEEIKPTMVDKMDREKTFIKGEIQNGDIICVQKKLNQEEHEVLVNEQKYPMVPEFLDFLFYRIDIIFSPRYDRDPTMEFKLVLRKNMPYDQVVALVADKLNANPAKVQLFVPETANSEEPVSIRSTSPPFMLNDLLRHMNRLMLLYQVHNIPLTELEMKRTLDITVCTPTLSDRNTMKVTISKRGTIADVLQILQSQGATFKSKNGTRQPRVFEAWNNKFHREFIESDLVKDISETSIARLYAEEVSQEEIQINDENEDMIYLPVFHYQRDLQRTHSIPFRLLLLKDEEFGETKKRLQQRTGINDKDWNKVKFSLVSSTYISKPIQEDNIKLWDLKIDQHTSLGLDHIDKVGRAIRSAFDKPLSIRG